MKLTWKVSALYIQVFDIECVSLDELPAWFYLVTHQGRKDLVSCNGVLDGYLQQPADFGIHGRLPELTRVHFTEALVTLDMLTALCFLHEPVECFAKTFDRLSFFPARDGSTVHDQAIEFLSEFADLSVVCTLEEIQWQQLLRMNAMHLADDCDGFLLLFVAQFDGISITGHPLRVQTSFKYHKPLITLGFIC